MSLMAKRRLDNSRRPRSVKVKAILLEILPIAISVLGASIYIVARLSLSLLPDTGVFVPLLCIEAALGCAFYISGRGWAFVGQRAIGLGVMVVRAPIVFAMFVVGVGASFRVDCVGSCGADSRVGEAFALLAFALLIPIASAIVLAASDATSVPHQASVARKDQEALKTR